MGYEEWIRMGMERGWISAPLCLTHDGTPTSQEEDESFCAGFDPCIVGCRVYGDYPDSRATRLEVEANHPGSIFRKDGWIE